MKRNLIIIAALICVALFVSMAGAAISSNTVSNGSTIAASTVQTSCCGKAEVSKACCNGCEAGCKCATTGECKCADCKCTCDGCECAKTGKCGCAKSQQGCKDSKGGQKSGGCCGSKK